MGDAKTPPDPVDSQLLSANGTPDRFNITADNACYFLNRHQPPDGNGLSQGRD